MDVVRAVLRACVCVRRQHVMSGRPSRRVVRMRVKISLNWSLCLSEYFVYDDIIQKLDSGTRVMLSSVHQSARPYMYHTRQAINLVSISHPGGSTEVNTTLVQGVAEGGRHKPQPPSRRLHVPRNRESDWIGRLDSTLDPTRLVLILLFVYAHIRPTSIIVRLGCRGVLKVSPVQTLMRDKSNAVQLR